MLFLDRTKAIVYGFFVHHARLLDDFVAVVVEDVLFGEVVGEFLADADKVGGCLCVFFLVAVGIPVFTVF